MKRKHKQYSRPRKAFDSARFAEEAKLKEEFGLKNKREIWKAEARVKTIREKAKKLIGTDQKDQKALFERLKKIGLNVNSIPEILGLDKKDFLQRRLQTVLLKRKLARTSKGARQLITHKKVEVNGNVVDSPSYIVPVSMEEKISLKIKNKVTKSQEVPAQNE